MRQAAVLFAHLMVVWLLLSGHYTATLITYGAISCLGVVLLMSHLRILDPEALPVHFGIRPFLYLPWLFKEIVLSNIAIARVILDPRLPIHPRIIRVRVSPKSDVAQVIYANSITLTPGTITLDARGGEFLVHALTDASAEGVLSGEMDSWVAWLEGGDVASDSESGADAS